AQPPAARPPGPFAWVSKTTFREIRLTPVPPVAWESTGRPTVTQRAATSGSANTAGKNRVRARGVARGARIRRGRWMYECRIVRSAAAGLCWRLGRRWHSRFPQEGDSAWLPSHSDGALRGMYDLVGIR